MFILHLFDEKVLRGPVTFHNVTQKQGRCLSTNKIGSAQVGTEVIWVKVPLTAGFPVVFPSAAVGFAASGSGVLLVTTFPE